jgi:hypothetical protein
MPNLLGQDSLIEQYPRDAAGQLKYLVDLTQLVIDNGGSGTVYWEPGVGLELVQDALGHGLGLGERHVLRFHAATTSCCPGSISCATTTCSRGAR